MAPPSAIDPPAAADTFAPTFIERLNVNGVPSRRSKGAILPKGLAPATSSDVFKGPQFGKPKARRWDHIISAESKARQPSSLKGAAKFLKQPGLISLGGGLPSSEYFPIEKIDFKMPQRGHFSEKETEESGVTVSIGKHDIEQGKSLYDLHVALNYGQATGSAQLLRFVTEHTEIVHNPPYADWQSVLTTGSTSALDIAFRMLFVRGDILLTDEYAFSSTVESGRPLGVQSCGVKMDDEGLVPADMDRILSTWDPSKWNGSPRPKVLYTVPTGQNPTGATQSRERRQEIYKLCQKHDVYILEDEPYYFLQMQPWKGAGAPAAPPPKSHEEFLSSLVPSFLSMDIDGRVMRLDSFSKVIAPGTRCGWITASEQIIERFVRHQEVSTQNPSGISQIMLYKMLDETWGHAGYLDWLIDLRMHYTHRRDILLAACDKYLPREVVSWAPPAAGMFHWLTVHTSEHPCHKNKSPKTLCDIEEDIFLAGIERGVLTSRGSWFRAEGADNLKRIVAPSAAAHGEPAESPEIDAENDDRIYFRTTFAAASGEDIELAIQRFGEALRSVFGLKQRNGHAA